MKKSKLISLIVAVLLVNSLLLVGILKNHNTATRTLKTETNFVSGSKGVASEELKAAAVTPGDDFITTAIGQKIASSKKTKKGDQNQSDKSANNDQTGGDIIIKVPVPR